jgi:ABC-type multidrug transport system fused ATPase/permease subunit
MERVAEHPIAPANLGSQLVPKNNSIKLEMVAFGYDRNNLSDLVLKNLSLDIKANTTVGFVGSSGSGKTTTVDLILGLLKPFEGRLSIGGVDLNKLERSQLAKIMGYVPQHIFLTDDSIATNIAFGVKPEDIDMDAVIRASEAANLHDFISDQLPEGYQTFVGERGVRLSGGQRQRIGIARALYQDPDILVLDEATSALDNATEQAVMDAVIRLKSKKTIILIAHRLSTIESCDRVFVFDGGEVVDEGSYAELEENSNAFRRLANVV